MIRILDAKTGGDPVTPIREANEAPTFQEFTDDYWRRWSPNWQPSTARTNRIYRDHYLLPAFKRLFLDQIDPTVVYQHYAAWSQTSPGAADRTLSILRHMFNKAEEWGERLPFGNPCYGFQLNRRRRVGRHLTEEELPRFGAALDALELCYPLQVNAVRLLLLTGCRSGEVLGLRWDDVMGNTIHLRTSKTGQRTVMVNDAAAAVLERIPRSRHSPYIFPKPGRQPGHLVRINGFWKNQLLPLAGVEKLRRHDLRHTFASHAASGEENTMTIAKLLGHSDIRSTHRYMHLADRPAADSAERMDALLAGALEAGTQQAAAGMLWVPGPKNRMAAKPRAKERKGTPCRQQTRTQNPRLSSNRGSQRSAPSGPAR